MAETSSYYKELAENIRVWPFYRKLALAGVALLSMVLFGLIIFQAGKAEYRALYTDLPRDEASEITSMLQEQGVPYELESNGRSIYVPADKVHQLRLDMAGEGLPKQGGMGFEVFDEQNFGQTKFTQKVNFQRAMQGELARTIASMDQVKSARVHLVLPEDRLLQESREPAKASVVVDLAGGASLGSSHTTAISHMVAGAIEGLDKNQVTVIDTQGRTLSQNAGQDPGSAMLPDKLKFKNTLEGRLEDRVQSLLDSSLGRGNSVVRITTDIDFTSQDITTEEYDPDSLVPRSEEITESSSTRAQTGGVPGTEANLDQGEETDAGGRDSEARTSEIVNYEINRTVKQTQRPAGDVENISAAVMVADSYDPEANEGEGGYVSVPQEKLESIRTMVTSAIGLNSERGDRVEVVSMPFEKESMEQAPAETGPALYEYLPYAKYIVLAIFALLVYLALIRPMVKTLRGEVGRGRDRWYPEIADESGAEGGEHDAPAKLRRELDHYSVTPAQVVKAWLKEG